jgi:molybdopterin-guanine dinucleotide biosynthesis protein A
MEHKHTSIPVVILAGGQSNRLQVGNKLKWQLPFNGSHSSDCNHHPDNFLDNSLINNNTSPPICHKHDQTLLAFIIERLKTQTDRIIINGPYIEKSELKKYKLPIISDQLPGFQGPLSGILTALHWAKEQGIPWVATVSCDTPFFPEDLLQTLSNDMLDQPKDGKKRAAIAAFKNRTHPTFGLWSIELYEPLNLAMDVENSRALNRWALQYAKTVKFEASPDTKDSTELKGSLKVKESTIAKTVSDPFFNINTLDDYKEALSYLA